MNLTTSPHDSDPDPASDLDVVAGGHDACEGFCPVCGVVAPCYRGRRDLACA